MGEAETADRETIAAQMQAVAYKLETAEYQIIELTMIREGLEGRLAEMQAEIQRLCGALDAMTKRSEQMESLVNHYVKWSDGPSGCAGYID